MDISENLPSPVAMQSRIEAANAWMTTCHVLVPSPIFKVTGQNCVAVHSAATGQTLFSLDWSRVMFVVEVAEGARMYLFHDLKDALTFLSCVLLNYLPAQHEPRSTDYRRLNSGRI